MPIDKWNDPRLFVSLVLPQPCVVCGFNTDLMQISFEKPMHIGLCFKKWSMEYFADQIKTPAFAPRDLEWEWWENLPHE